MSQSIKKHNIEKLAIQLDNILSREIDFIPYKKKNTVYIHDYRIVKKDKTIYLVYHKQTLIANCFYKKSAFAIVQRLLNNRTYSDILDHDSRLEKNYNDSIFYLNTISNTTSSVKLDIASTRLDVSKGNIAQHIAAIAESAKWHNG